MLQKWKIQESVTRLVCNSFTPFTTE
jgi:hypothetical protein